MPLLAIALLILAAFLHAGWNFLTKRSKPSLAFFFLANIWGSLLLLPFFLLSWPLVPEFPPELWKLLGMTGFFLAVYTLGLAVAYKSGEISLAYPLARSAPVILVTLVSLATGHGHELSLSALLGIGIVVLGCFFIPLQRFSEIRLRSYLNKTCAFALVAAVGTAGYSLIDDHSIKLLHRTFSQSNVLTLALLYAFLEMACTGLWIRLFIFFQPANAPRVREAFKTQKRTSALAAVGFTSAYILVLTAMAMVPNISSIVAFRQLSIPIGVFLGVFFLKETLHPPKRVGIALILVGLILVGR